MFRVLLSGRDIGRDSRVYSVLWSIMSLEPGRFPLPLLYEAVARGACDCLTAGERQAVKHEVQWACRALRAVLTDVSGWGNGSREPTRSGPEAARYATAVLDMQDSIGLAVADYLAESDPDWVDEIASNTWHELGGW